MSAGLQACDRGGAGAAGGGRAAHGPWVLAACILASSLAFVDGSVVNVGLPAISRSLHGNAADLQWVINAYLLPLSALLLTGGALGDRFGRKLLLIVGIILFAAASLGCAIAPSLPLMLAGRAGQGIGAALLLPNSLAILGGAFTGQARGRAVGIWAATGAIAGAVGPVLGGWLIDTTGWRAIFLINLPLAAAGVVLAWIFVEEARDALKARLDAAGALLATLALGTLTWALTVGSGPQGWTPAAILMGAAGIALTAAFAWAEKVRGDRAMTPLTLFASGGFVGLTLLTLLLYAALSGLLVLVPYVLIESDAYSGTAAGSALLPFPVILALASPLMGGVAGRFGSRLPLSVGPVIVAGGFLLLLRVQAHGSYWTQLLPAILVIALGMAGAVAPLTTAVLNAVDERHIGSASGFNSAVARIGGLIATALLGAILAARGDALIRGFHAAAVVGALAALGAGISAFLLVKGREKTREPPRAGRTIDPAGGTARSVQTEGK